MFQSSIYNIQKRNNDILLLPKQEHKYTIVWLHGLGDSALGFSDLFLSQQHNLSNPQTKIVLLTAPTRPVTINGGMEMTKLVRYKIFRQILY
ncbi:phospholipase carboxylesterase family protein, putative [Ichthyophthirius multifiliis]|uniref:Phospholipase carboxylesterase family protein, putative n=1 Tax=Ichthyophthirius multifiliis TaxID=5932 RepID=G0R6K9_ICHMU|nr:phospholipase carboxylesterase family protein, putative [Ichthyophthirius multifiliis]EGR26901.1 phospholipase carboxylesterase family protein, putative [Ichthyophthirius multifiliis]|eukprot:XP_004023785.1 phospholipase carboxylesterase family protein, putative [Ichthyophthirius multifiliis]